MKSDHPVPGRPIHETAALHPPALAEPALPPYEPPTLTPAGNLRDVLGKSGPHGDFTYRRTSSGRP
jgi:hypothetical protein